jgi:N-acetyl-anhydromuramyl-L-alanine amidase AmpD
MQIEQHWTPNRWPGALIERRYRVVHTTQGTSSLGWIKNPASGVSYGLLVPRDGPKVYALGDRAVDAFWHAGAVCDPITTLLYDGTNPNRTSDGVAFEGFAAEPLSAFQLEVWAELQRDDPLPWCGHINLAGCNRTDPGAANMAVLAAETEVDMLKPDERQALFDLVSLGHGQKNALEALARHLGAVAPVAAARRSSGRERDQKGAWEGPGPEPKGTTRPTAKRRR